MSAFAYKYVLRKPWPTEWHDWVHIYKNKKTPYVEFMQIHAHHFGWFRIRQKDWHETRKQKAPSEIEMRLRYEKQSCGYSLTHFWPIQESQAHCSIRLPLQWTAGRQLECGTHGENDRMWCSALSLCACAEDYCTPMPPRHIIRVYEMQNAQIETPRRYWLRRMVDEPPLGIQTRA